MGCLVSHYSDFPWLSAPIVLSLRFHYHPWWFYTIYKVCGLRSKFPKQIILYSNFMLVFPFWKDKNWELDFLIKYDSAKSFLFFYRGKRINRDQKGLTIAPHFQVSPAWQGRPSERPNHTDHGWVSAVEINVLRNYDNHF